LSRTDIAGGFVSSDVLFPGLQSKPERWLTISITRLTDNPAGHLAAKRIAGREESGMGAASTHRNTKTLCASNSNVGTKLSNRRKQHLGEGIHSSSHQSSAVMGSIDAS
jgi:hypothetical protein